MFTDISIAKAALSGNDERETIYFLIVLSYNKIMDIIIAGIIRL